MTLVELAVILMTVALVIAVGRRPPPTAAAMTQTSIVIRPFRLLTLPAVFLGFVGFMVFAGFASMSRILPFRR